MYLLVSNVVAGLGAETAGEIMEITFETINNVENGLGIPYFTALELKSFGLHVFYELQERGT